MKLYKQTTRYHEGMDFDAFETASLQDIRQAAKEFKCVVVPMESIKVSYFTGGAEWLSFPKAILQAAEAADE